MPELLDVLDEKGNRTGKIITRGQMLKEGEYVAMVLVFLCNQKREYLIQKRSMKKSHLPGIWDVTAGVVISREESHDAAIREVQEEIGITLSRDNIHFQQRLIRAKAFVDLYFALADFKLSECRLQEEEVDEVRFVTARELKQLITGAEYWDKDYRNIVCDAIERMELYRIDDVGDILQKDASAADRSGKGGIRK
jgi:8-oxo-dGTP pyrophosphatase MutT (NUDIX family)